MMRPGGGVELASLLALAGALMIAVVNVLVKKLAATERPVTILFHFGVISTIATLVPALVVWRGPTPVELLLLVLVGVLGMAAQACMIRGLRLGEATAVIPFDYVRLLIAGVVGFLVFAEVPDRWTLIGAAVIVTATLYIALREARLGKSERSTLGDGEALPPRAE
jgi:drug/metabolite transporter (DMT)-like permease